MIDSIIQAIISDLGATGLLIIGLYFVIMKATRKISQGFALVAHEVNKIYIALENSSCVERDILDELKKLNNGKIKGPTFQR